MSDKPPAASGEILDSLMVRLRRQVRDLAAYHLEPLPARVKLDQNENSWGLPKPIAEDIRRTLSMVPLNRYPEVVPTQLKQALGSLNDWPADGVLVGNGSNELLLMLALSTLEAGKTAVAPTPSFAIYGYVTRLVGAQFVEVPLALDFSYDIDAFIQVVVARRPSLVFLCTPNNPTGSTLAAEQVRRVADHIDGLLVVDEAYFEFGGSAARSLLPDNPHVVVLRTFSKAMSLAGGRIGYLLAHPDLAREIDKAQLPYALNRISRALSLTVCRHYSLIQDQAASIVNERENVFRRLEALDGVRPFPSGANFILFACEAGAAPVFQGLLARGVLVRNLSSHPRLRGMLRVTIGRPEENAAFLKALHQTLEELR